MQTTADQIKTAADSAAAFIADARERAAVLSDKEATQYAKDSATRLLQEALKIAEKEIAQLRAALKA